MKLTTLTIRNFRALENISVAFGPIANVIVGPNAVGKTTILEALRLAKGTLAPRTLDEAQHVFTNLGAISPHVPQRLNYRVLARDTTRPLSIVATFEMSPDEVSKLNSLSADLATAIVRASMGASIGAQGQLALVQFLSSPAGVNALDTARKQVETLLGPVKSNSRITLDLEIDPTAGTIRGANQFDQIVLAGLEGKLPPNQTLFSYFPADRALPPGEIPIQVGGQDAALQLQSHNSQPQLKYARLKSTIINSMFEPSVRERLVEDFKKLFSRVLKDRELVDSSIINDFGLISVQIKDLINGRTFDIDQMSSGEKGLILTFLIISSSVAPGGIILIDEPELHLNPAVCKLLVPFLIDECLEPKKIQAIICSHSPEILGAAFDRKDCALYHLQSPTIISKIYPEDRREVFDALRRLGTSASDVLFSNGSIFVEGDQDVEILDIGFNKLLSRYKVTQLGGRGSVEREIKTLQRSAPEEEFDTVKCFIFDLDNIPTGLTSTKLVKVLQWKRRCLENYLIDEKIIYDLLKRPELSAKSIPTRGEVTATFKAIAMSQIPKIVIERVYNRLAYENPGFRPKDVANRTFPEAAGILFARLGTIQSQLCGLSAKDWCDEFSRKCEEESAKEGAIWEADWLALCDGKRFFLDIHSQFELRIGPQQFKKLIIEKMEKEQSEGWVLVEKLLSDSIRI
jgi:predicted ATPase/acetolactate synthase small subunit